MRESTSDLLACVQRCPSRKLEWMSSPCPPAYTYTMSNQPRSPRPLRAAGVCLGLALLVLAIYHPTHADKVAPPDPGNDYATHIRPLVKKYCLDCHSTKTKKGSLD